MIVGIDEVGRGAWAGPVVACAVAVDPIWLSKDGPLKAIEDYLLLTKVRPFKITDSKKLSALQRVNAANFIRKNVDSIGIGWVSAKEIDKNGITNSIATAMKRAVDALSCSIDEIILDGNTNFLPGLPVTTLVGADATVLPVSAASIIAKVVRDDFMHRLSNTFPIYEFDRHVGYGTAAHRRAIERSGPCILHRFSYKPIADLT